MYFVTKWIHNLLQGQQLNHKVETRSEANHDTCVPSLNHPVSQTSHREKSSHLKSRWWAGSQQCLRAGRGGSTQENGCKRCGHIVYKSTSAWTRAHPPTLRCTCIIGVSVGVAGDRDLDSCRCRHRTRLTSLVTLACFAEQAVKVNRPRPIPASLASQPQPPPQTSLETGFGLCAWRPSGSVNCRPQTLTPPLSSSPQKMLVFSQPSGLPRSGFQSPTPSYS